MSKQTAAQYVKSQGLKTMIQLEALSSVKVRTLNDYWHNNPLHFKVIVAGVKAMQSADTMVIDGATWIKLSSIGE
jgi:hypothetical protein